MKGDVLPSAKKKHSLGYQGVDWICIAIESMANISTKLITYYEYRPLELLIDNLFYTGCE